MVERCIEQGVAVVLVSQITGNRQHAHTEGLKPGGKRVRVRQIAAVQHHIGAQLLRIPARAAL